MTEMKDNGASTDSNLQSTDDKPTPRAKVKRWYMKVSNEDFFNTKEMHILKIVSGDNFEKYQVLLIRLVLLVCNDEEYSTCIKLGGVRRAYPVDAMAEQFHMDKNTIRNGLEVLEQVGLIEKYISIDGAYVVKNVIKFVGSTTAQATYSKKYRDKKKSSDEATGGNGYSNNDKSRRNPLDDLPF